MLCIYAPGNAYVCTQKMAGTTCDIFSSTKSVTSSLKSQLAIHRRRSLHTGKE